MVAQLRKAISYVDAAIHVFASTKVAVCLVAALAAVLAVATVIETLWGRPFCQWYVYHTSWFVGLLGLLGANAFCAAYVRFPWKRHHTGLVLTHIGLLVMLAGAALTLYSGVEGQVQLLQGASTDQLTVSHQSQITASWVDRPHARPYVFIFDSGPVDWRRGTELDLGRIDGMGVRVLKYYRHSYPIEKWAADPEGHGGPLIRFELEGTRSHVMDVAGHPAVDQPIVGSLADQDYGAEIFVGPIAVRLQRATSNAMLQDFLHPVESDLGKDGVLTVYYKDNVQHVPVDTHIGQGVKIGESGAAVELVHYFANAKLDVGGQFKSIGNNPRNPLVELKVTVPGEKQPFRQVAFAKSPLLNFDGVYGRDCPMRFVYRHPQFKPTNTIEFLQGSDGKLYGRAAINGTCKALGEVTTGRRLEIQGGFAFRINEYLPHARRDISFKPAGQTANEDLPRKSSAAEVEVTVAGTSQTLWLERNNSEYYSGEVNTSDGPLRVQFTTAKLPLGFSLKFLEFRRMMNPGQAGGAANSSIVTIRDKTGQSEEKGLVSLNHPLVHYGYRIYQSSLHRTGHGKEASVFTVTYDPGRPLKYLGSLMFCLGVAASLYRKSHTTSGGVPECVASSESTETPFRDRTLRRSA